MKMFRNTSESIEKEFDAVNFVRLQKHVRILMKLLLEETERAMLPFNRKFMASKSTDSESDMTILNEKHTLR